MGLFGEYTTVEQRKPLRISLFNMAKERFPDDADLLNEIHLYLQNCKQKRLYPSRTSWEMQLDLLEKVPQKERAAQVRNSTLHGYRTIAFINDKKEKMNKNVGKVVKEGF